MIFYLIYMHMSEHLNYEAPPHHIFLLTSDGYFFEKFDLEELLGDDAIIYCTGNGNGHMPKIMDIHQSGSVFKPEQLCDRHYHCDFKGCDEEFKDGSELQEHRIIHILSHLTFKCDVCGSTRKSKRLPKRHKTHIDY
jgi:hypothetical protein